MNPELLHDFKLFMIVFPPSLVIAIIATLIIHWFTKLEDTSDFCSKCGVENAYHGIDENTCWKPKEK